MVQRFGFEGSEERKGRKGEEKKKGKEMGENQPTETPTEIHFWLKRFIFYVHS